MNTKETRPLISNRFLKYNAKERSIEHYISTETVNRYGYILKNDGMKTDNYSKNPIVLYNHTLGGFFNSPNPKELIIGKNLNFHVDKVGIAAVTQFADTELGNDILNMNVEGLMSSWSVGWDSEREFDIIDGVSVMPEWELLEYSSVIIPANPDAVNKMLSITRTESLKQVLSYNFTILAYKEEMDNELKSLKLNIDTLLSEMNSLKQGKQLTDVKNEMKSVIQNNKKDTTELFFKVVGKLQNLESNLYDSLSNKMQHIVEAAIKKHFGKVS